MSFLRFLIWTAASVAFGVFLGSADIGGKTPLDHLETIWQRHAPADPLQELRRQVTTATTGAPDKPVETYSSEDKNALNKLVAKSSAKK